MAQISFHTTPEEGARRTDEGARPEEPLEAIRAAVQEAAAPLLARRLNIDAGMEAKLERLVRR